MTAGIHTVRRLGWVDIEPTPTIARNTGGIIRKIRQAVTQGTAVTKAGRSTPGTMGTDGANTVTNIRATNTNIIISATANIGIAGTRGGKTITTIITDLRNRA